jgi:DNA polymerase III delta prime subunit
MKQILNEKYRPKNLDEYVFSSDEHRELVEKWVKQGIIPHIMLHGHRGTGKTTLAYILRDLTGVQEEDFLEINSSSKGTVDTIRDLVYDFVSTVPFGEYKIVLLDEVDGMSKQAQKALRGIVQEFSDNARFILTCNNPNAVDTALRSRCQEIRYRSVDKETMTLRVAEILENENIKTSIKNLEAYITRFYPDFRKLLEMIDQNTFDGVLKNLDDIADDVAEPDYELALVEIIEGNNYRNWRSLVTSITGEDEWIGMYTFLAENIHELGKFRASKDKADMAIVIINDHVYKHEFVAVPWMNAASMIIRLGGL